MCHVLRCTPLVALSRSGDSQGFTVTLPSQNAEWRPLSLCTLKISGSGFGDVARMLHFLHRIWRRRKNARGRKRHKLPASGDAKRSGSGLTTSLLDHALAEAQVIEQVVQGGRDRGQVLLHLTIRSLSFYLSHNPQHPRLSLLSNGVSVKFSIPSQDLYIHIICTPLSIGNVCR